MLGQASRRHDIDGRVENCGQFAFETRQRTQSEHTRCLDEHVDIGFRRLRPLRNAPEYAGIGYAVLREDVHRTLPPLCDAQCQWPRRLLTQQPRYFGLTPPHDLGDLALRQPCRRGAMRGIEQEIARLTPQQICPRRFSGEIIKQSPSIVHIVNAITRLLRTGRTIER